MDETLRMQALRAAVRDSSFLLHCWQDIRPEFFPTREEQTVAKAALDFYSVHKEPIGPLLRNDTEELAAANKFGAESKKKLHELVDKLLGPKMELVSVKALEERLKRLKESTFYENAVNDILTAQEEGKLSAETLSSLVRRASIELSGNGYLSSYYVTGLQRRIERRRRDALLRYPLFMIEPLDNRMKGLGRGRLGVIMAPPTGGKGLMLVYLTGALAIQGFNVLHITLEDPRKLVEDRLDASLTGLKLKDLNRLPNKLRRKFLNVKSTMGNRIKIIENLDSPWTVTDIERAWEHERQQGFIADAIMIDYDEFLVAEKTFKGDSAKRFEIEEIYTRLKQLAAKLNVVLWTAAQTTRGAEKQKVIQGKHTAESYAKFRRCFIMIGIGEDPDDEHLKWFNVIKNREGRGNMLVPIMSDFASALIYDIDQTAIFNRNPNRRKPMKEDSDD